MIERPSARLILLDPQDRLFLFNVHDPGVFDPANPHFDPFWVMIGGFVDPGEDFADAAGILWFIGVILALLLLFALGSYLRGPLSGIWRWIARGAIVVAVVALCILANIARQTPPAPARASKRAVSAKFRPSAAPCKWAPASA